MSRRDDPAKPSQIGPVRLPRSPADHHARPRSCRFSSETAPTAAPVHSSSAWASAVASRTTARRASAINRYAAARTPRSVSASLSATASIWLTVRSARSSRTSRGELGIDVHRRAVDLARLGVVERLVHLCRDHVGVGDRCHQPGAECARGPDQPLGLLDRGDQGAELLIPVGDRAPVVVQVRDRFAAVIERGVRRAFLRPNGGGRLGRCRMREGSCSPRVRRRI